MHSGGYWPTGSDVVEWTGAIRPLASSTALMLYIGRLHTETTESEVVETIKELYTENQVTVTVSKQPNPDRFGNLAFAVKVVHSDASNKTVPEDLVTPHMKSLHAFVRNWVGGFPRAKTEQYKRVRLGAPTENQQAVLPMEETN